MSAKHGRFDLGFLQRVVVSGLFYGSGGDLLRIGECLLGFGQLTLQACQLGLLRVVAGVQLLQLAQLSAKHGRFDLGFLHGLVVGRGGRGFGCRRGGIGGIQGLLRLAGGDTQLGDLCLELGRGVGGELLFSFLQRDLGHAGFDLEFLLLFGQAGFQRLGR